MFIHLLLGFTIRGTGKFANLSAMVQFECRGYLIHTGLEPGDVGLSHRKETV
jgi:hypothetical protein